jgi:hypothetical protein
MTSHELTNTDENKSGSTGRWYDNGRINVNSKTAKSVPWPSSTQLVVYYDEVANELRIKPLFY